MSKALQLPIPSTTFVTMKILVLIAGLMLFTYGYAQTAQKMYDVGIEYYRAENYKKAILAFNRAIQLDSNYVDAYYYRAWSKQVDGDNQGALIDYTKVIAFRPKHVDAFYFRGMVKGMLNDAQGAIADFSTAITLNPNYGEAYFNRAMVRFNLKQLEEGCKDMNKALTLNVADADLALKQYCK
jgi:tetratricopeptide (TPR) repeat protein